jgi:ABC-2 type transport system permease protein
VTAASRLRASAARCRILIVREATELLRDRISLAIIFAMPFFMLVLFTFALATDVKDMPLAVFDAGDSPRSRALVQAIDSTRYFRVERISSLRGIEPRLASGEVAALLVIPPDVERRFAADEVAEAALVLEGSEAILAANAEAILASIVARFDVRLARRPAPPDLAAPGQVRLEARALYNPRLDSEHYMIPGLFGYIFTFLAIVVAAISIVRERVIGTFEQLMVTPVMPVEIAGAKLGVLGAAMLVDQGVVLVVSGLSFGVWPKGSVALLFASTALYLLMTLSVGLLISAGSKSPDEALTKALVTATPLLNVSGLVFPTWSMPPFFRWLASVLPVSHYLRLCRGIYLTGAGLRDVLPDLGVIAAYLVVLAILLARRLGKEREL